MYDRTKKRSRKRRRNTDNRTVHPGTHRINDKLYGKCTADCQKAEVGQLARCYLLKMETVGYLAAQDQTQLTAELENLGMTGIDYEGSTLNPAGYGNDVVLQIHGRLGETYEIYEKRVSTAKN